MNLPESFSVFSVPRVHKKQVETESSQLTFLTYAYSRTKNTRDATDKLAGVFKVLNVNLYHWRVTTETNLTIDRLRSYVAGVNCRKGEMRTIITTSFPGSHLTAPWRYFRLLWHIPVYALNACYPFCRIAFTIVFLFDTTLQQRCHRGA